MYQWDKTAKREKWSGVYSVQASKWTLRRPLTLFNLPMLTGSAVPDRVILRYVIYAASSPIAFIDCIWAAIAPMVCIRIMQPETLVCKVCAASMSYAWQGVSSGPWVKQPTLAPLPRRKRASSECEDNDSSDCTEPDHGFDWGLSVENNQVYMPSASTGTRICVAILCGLTVAFGIRC